VSSFLDPDELMGLGLRSCGERALVSRKASVYGASQVTLGHDVRIDDFCVLSGPISIGHFVHIAAFCALYGGEAGIEVSDFCNLSSRVTIYAVSDDYSGETLTNPMIPAKYKNLEHGKVTLGRHVIVGSGSVLLPGVAIGEGCAIGALSLVKGDLPGWRICAGTPARPIKERRKGLLPLEQTFLRDRAR
jgi:galactoside O-acetyltransferase